MITGFNTDVKHKSKTYHVQTEDKGRHNPKIESLVYVGGEILDSHQTSYDAKNDTMTEDDIMVLMEKQHKRVIRTIKTGNYDQADQFNEDVLSERSLDDLITHYLEQEPIGDQLKLVVNGLSGLRKSLSAPIKAETSRALAGDPIKQAQIRIKLVSGNRVPTLLAEGETDEAGAFATSIQLENVPGEDAAIIVQAMSDWGTAEQKFQLRH